jgi:hypothetical protein
MSMGWSSARESRGSSASTSFADDDVDTCPMGCRGADLCDSCRQSIKLEAMAWLRDLSDGVFGSRDDADAEVIIIRGQGWLSPGAQRYR